MAASKELDDSIRVVCRVRPLLGSNGRLAIEAATDSTLIAGPQSFNFDYVAPHTSCQEQLFDETAKPIADACLAGFNGTVFAYGQTGSGKTFTVHGPTDSIGQPSWASSENTGLLPRSIAYLFDRIREAEKTSEGKLTYAVKASFLEIYNERVYDLLDQSNGMAATAGDSLQVRERSAARGQPLTVFVEGLTESPVGSADEANALVVRGIKSRSVGATAMNRDSSRSHSVFTMLIESSQRDGKLTKTRTARFHIIDLAGSERQKVTQAAGERLKEAGQINKSLSALGGVMSALVDISNGAKRHVHYRDSKLTMLLRDSLGGNSRTVLIATVSPTEDCFAETLSTLRFASMAKRVRNKAVVNEDTTASVAELQAELRVLRAQVAEYKTLISATAGASEGAGAGAGSSSGGAGAGASSSADMDEDGPAASTVTAVPTPASLAGKILESWDELALGLIARTNEGVASKADAAALARGTIDPVTALTVLKQMHDQMDRVMGSGSSSSDQPTSVTLSIASAAYQRLEDAEGQLCTLLRSKEEHEAEVDVLRVSLAKAVAEAGAWKKSARTAQDVADAIQSKWETLLASEATNGSTTAVGADGLGADAARDDGMAVDGEGSGADDGAASKENATVTAGAAAAAPAPSKTARPAAASGTNRFGFPGTAGIRRPSVVADSTSVAAAAAASTAHSSASTLGAAGRRPSISTMASGAGAPSMLSRRASVVAGAPTAPAPTGSKIAGPGQVAANNAAKRRGSVVQASSTAAAGPSAKAAGSAAGAASSAATAPAAPPSFRDEFSRMMDAYSSAREHAYAASADAELTRLRGELETATARLRNRSVKGSGADPSDDEVMEYISRSEFSSLKAYVEKWDTELSSLREMMAQTDPTLCLASAKMWAEGKERELAARIEQEQKLLEHNHAEMEAYLVDKKRRLEEDANGRVAAAQAQATAAVASLQGQLADAEGRAEKYKSMARQLKDGLEAKTAELDRSLAEAAQQLEAVRAQLAEVQVEKERSEADNLAVKSKVGQLAMDVEAANSAAQEAESARAAAVARVRELGGEVERLEGELDSAKAQLADHKAMATELQAQVKTLGEELAQASSENSEAAGRLVELEAGLAASKDTVASLQTAVGQARADAVEAEQARQVAVGRITSLQGELEETTAALDTARAQLATSSGQVEQLQASMSGLQEEKSQVTAALAEAQTTITALGESKAAAEASASAATSEVSRLTTELSSAIGDVGCLRADKAALELELTNVKAELAEANEDVSGFQAELAAAIESARASRAEAATAEAATAQAQTQVAELTTTLAEAKQRLTAAEGREASVSAQLQDAQCELVSVRAELQSVQASNAELSAELSAELAEANGRVEQLQAEVEASRGNTAAIAAELATANESVVRVTSELACAKDEVVQLTGKLTAVETTTIELTGQLASATAAAEGTRMELEGARASITGLTGELVGARASITGLTSELEGARASITGLTGELEGARASITGLTGELEGARASITGLTGELEGARASITGLTGELEGARAETGAFSEQLESAKAHITKLEGQLDEADAEIEGLEAKIEGLHGEMSSLMDQNLAQAEIINSAPSSTTAEAVAKAQTTEAAVNTSVIVDQVAAPAAPTRADIELQTGEQEQAAGQMQLARAMVDCASSPVAWPSATATAAISAAASDVPAAAVPAPGPVVSSTTRSGPVALPGLSDLGAGRAFSTGANLQDVLAARRAKTDAAAAVTEAQGSAAAPVAPTPSSTAVASSGPAASLSRSVLGKRGPATRDANANGDASATPMTKRFNNARDMLAGVQPLPMRVGGVSVSTSATAAGGVALPGLAGAGPSIPEDNENEE